MLFCAATTAVQRDVTRPVLLLSTQTTLAVLLLKGLNALRPSPRSRALTGMLTLRPCWLVSAVVTGATDRRADNTGATLDTTVSSRAWLLALRPALTRSVHCTWTCTTFMAAASMRGSTPSRSNLGCTVRVSVKLVLAVLPGSSTLVTTPVAISCHDGSNWPGSVFTLT